MMTNYFLDAGKCTNFDVFTDQDTLLLKSLQKSFTIQPPQLKDSIVILHKLPGQAVPSSLKQSSFLIGRMMTEGTFLSQTEIEQAQIFNEIWVPTPFHATIFVSSGISSNKIQVIPESVDVSFYSENQEISSPKFRFVSVFKYEKRKGFDVLLSAYWKTFQKDDAVELVIRSYKPSWESGPSDLNQVFNMIAIREFGKSMSDLASVIWIRDELTKHELRSLYHSADLFVLPTRGEGWCLPCAEAMAAGIPLIVTNFSGPTYYLNEEHSYPLSYDLNTLDGSAEPNLDHLAQLMQYAVNNPDDCRIKGLKAKLYAATHFDPVVVARKIITRINTIAQVPVCQEL